MASTLVDYSFLFTYSEREAIYYSRSDRETRPESIVTRQFQPLWRCISERMLSPNVAPNTITAVGVLSSLQAYQLISSYYHYGEPKHRSSNNFDVFANLNAFGVRGAGHSPLGVNVPSAVKDAFASKPYGWGPQTNESPFPKHYDHFFHANRTVQTATALAFVLLFSLVCGSLDGVHAKRWRSATSLGDIFSRACSSISRIFTALTILEIMQVDDVMIKWYLLLTVQLIEFNTMLGRINAENIKKDTVKNWAFVATYFFRDSELTFLMVLLLFVRWFSPRIAECVRDIPLNYARDGYTVFVLISLLNIWLMKLPKRYKVSIALCLLVRVSPLFYLLPLSEYNTLSVIGDTIVVGLLTIEVYVSHLARRRIHALVVMVCLGSMLNDVIAIVMSVVYIIGILVDLSYALNVPLFVPIRNVYIDGVFDLCHAGHKRMMANSLKYGNRLIVGVCGDEECVNYKRRPIMTLEERVNEVKLCKYVSEVIPDAPVSGVTEAMIKYYNIHIVVCGEEYDVPTDTYYAVPRKMGILHTIPRTQGISTSQLIERIRAASEEELSAKDKNDKMKGRCEV